VRWWWRTLRAALAELAEVRRLDRRLTRGEVSGPEALAELDEIETRQRLRNGER
jgi:hypothetical protein